MRRVLFGFTCTLLMHCLNASELPDSLRRTGGSVLLDAGVAFSGRGTNGSFLYDFYRGGFLDSIYLADQRSRLVYKNMFFAEGQQRVVVNWSPDSLLMNHGIRFGLSVRNTWRSSAVFTNDAYDLLFFGNRPYEEQIKNFSGSHFFLSSWFSAGLCASWESRSGGFEQRFSVGIYAVSGKRFYDAEIDRGWIYTAEEGTEIQAELRGSLNQSDTVVKATIFGSPSIGRGLSADLSYAFRKGKVSGFLSIEDVGFIDWVKGFGSFDADTAAVLRGYYINNLFNISDSLVQLSIDSLSNSVPKRNATRFRSGLPFAATARWVYAINATWRAGLAVRYLGLPAYLPRISAFAERKLSEKAGVMLEAGTGAGSMVFGSAAAWYRPINCLRIDLRFSDLQGLAGQAQSRGGGVFLHVLYQWN